MVNCIGVTASNFRARFVLLLHLVLMCFNPNAYGQKGLQHLRSNSSFYWVIDSLDPNLILYYEKDSYAERNRDVLIRRIKMHYDQSLSFIGVDDYDKPVHYFVLEDRDRMKLLVGYVTNGNANPKQNYITALYSEGIKSVYSNHELFHLMAMNLWGFPETWINEGLAVYSDHSWNGYDLHQLAKYLLVTGRFISLEEMAKRLRKYDSMVSYPLLGSFAKHIDETYGRDTLKIIWNKGRKGLKRHIGKSLADLEEEWLVMLRSVPNKDIQYMN